MDMGNSRKSNRFRRAKSVKGAANHNALARERPKASPSGRGGSRKADGEGDRAVRFFDAFQGIVPPTALSVTAKAVPALPKGEPWALPRHSF